ncbi:MAG: UbiX family flavin prenyltransferase [Candidatus Thermoplasmatota archaeon]|nr:UbiX family flavin prenyltransferase [Candidatus Thermoplasmatota archaeon]
MDRNRVVVALTGASGAGYGFELVKGLKEAGRVISVIYNDTALKILEDEHDLGYGDLEKYSDEMIHTSGMDHALASGSNPFDSMVISPCSTSTASKISAGIADNLATRCAAVALKEKRKLVLVVRETPLSSPVLRSLYDLSTWGVIVMPASPPLYGRSTGSTKEMMKAFSGRIMDLLGIDNDLSERYSPESTKSEKR